MNRLLASLACIVLAGCASGGHGSSTTPASAAGESAASSQEVVVVRLDATPRPALHPGDVAVMLYLDDKLPPQGCAPVAQMFTESNISGQMRRAVTEHAGALGATLVIITDRQQVSVETMTSRSGIGQARVSTRYALEAFDCR